MTQLRRARRGDHHLFIRAGWFKGIRQIKEAGVVWLKKRQYSLPAVPGGWIQLDRGDFQYLEKQELLYTRGETHTTSSVHNLHIPLLPAETVHYGAPLLLQLADNHHMVSNDDTRWILIIKLDEWEEKARDALIREKAAAVGYYTYFDAEERVFSSISLRQIHNADYWPEVAPKKEKYELHWQSLEGYQQESRSATRLKEATPTTGLKTGWQGNVFFKFTGNDLINTWKHYLPGMSIGANNVHECYWLATSDQEPDPSWPGKAQRVGQANRDWQLWHLQTGPETNLEDVAEWLRYRQIDVRYPTWRLHLLSPLSSISEQTCTCAPDQQLLVHCEPPMRHLENKQTSVHLSCISHSTVSSYPLPDSATKSQRFTSDSEHYLRIPAPPANQEYRMRVYVNENVQNQSLRVQSVPLPVGSPSWLHGLRCSLTIAGKQHTVEAFRDEATPESSVLSVDKDFSLEQLAQATWNHQPSGIPCSLHWEYLSVDEKSRLRDGASLSTDNMTYLWQTSIWPEVAECPWVKLTLDAASFGSISLRLDLRKPEPESAAASSWWTDARYTAPICWLSRMVEQEAAQAQQEMLLECSQALEHLCVPDMPIILKNALLHLATRRSLPIWISLRLQALLVDIYSIVELASKEGR